MTLAPSTLCQARWVFDQIPTGFQALTYASGAAFVNMN